MYFPSYCSWEGRGGGWAGDLQGSCGGGGGTAGIGGGNAGKVGALCGGQARRGTCGAAAAGGWATATPTSIHCLVCGISRQGWVCVVIVHSSRGS